MAGEKTLFANSCELKSKNLNGNRDAGCKNQFPCRDN